MPTGSGKTWLAEFAMAEVLERGGRAIYLTPLRALATELLERWQSTFSDYRVGVFTGEYGRKRKYPVPFDSAQLLIMTPERLDAVLDALAKGEQPKTGTQEPGRHTSEPAGGPTTLTEMVDANHDYRKEW